MVSAKQDMVTLKGRTDVAHIPYQPFWLLIVRGFQFLLALIIMALSAYSGSGYLVFYAGYGIGIFSFVWTLLFLGYIEITTFWAPAAYNKYVHLVLECLSVIFWLSTFASLAVVAAAWDFGYSAVSTCYGGYCIKARSYDYNGPANATKAAAALGAIEWVLFCGTLITFGIYLHRNRRATTEARQQGIVGNAVVEEHKMGAVTSQQPVYGQQGQQPTGYAQPTGYSQVPVDPRYQNMNMA